MPLLQQISTSLSKKARSIGRDDERERERSASVCTDSALIDTPAMGDGSLSIDHFDPPVQPFLQVERATPENSDNERPSRESLRDDYNAARHQGRPPSGSISDASVTSGRRPSNLGLDDQRKPRSMSNASKRSKARTATNPPSSGIGGALAMSGFALANPHAALNGTIPISRSAHSLDQTSPTRSYEDLPENPDSISPTSRNAMLTPPEGSPVPQSAHTFASSGSGSFERPQTPMISMDALGEFEDVINQLGSGYAVASSKRNTDFHALFKTVPEDDYLIEDYGCALQRDILVQGRLYISEHHLCFYANIFGWVTTLIVPFSEVVTIEKRMTAFVIPNAIHVATMHARHTFASFLSRDTTYDLITNIWRIVHPVVPVHASLPDATKAEESDDEGESKSKRRKSGSRRKRGKSVSIAVNADGAPVAVAANDVPTGKEKKQHHPVTDSSAVPEGKPLANVVMDLTFPATPEKIYNLMFTSGFMKDFLSNDMQLTELQISDWAPSKANQNLLERSMSYIKPLNAPVGPKSTKCSQVDENLYVDFDQIVVMLTVTRTPDVPSGGAFSVKTKSVLTWAKGNACRVIVTTAVEWTKSSFLKGIIERSALEGQKQLYAALEKRMRAYIAEHRSEFHDADDDSASIDENLANEESQEVAAALEQSTTISDPKQSKPSALSAVIEPIWESVKSVGEIFLDLYQNSTTMGLFASSAIIVLFISNVFSLLSLRSASSRHIPPRGPPSSLSSQSTSASPDLVAQAVKGVLHEYFSSNEGINALPAHQQPKKKHKLSSKEEAEEVRALLDALQTRITKLRQTLDVLESDDTNSQGLNDLD